MIVVGVEFIVNKEYSDEFAADGEYFLSFEIFWLAEILNKFFNIK